MDVDTQRNGNEHGTYRNPSLRLRSRDTGRRYADIGRQVVDGECRAHSGCHLARDVGVHRAVHGKEPGVDSEQAVLEGGVVGDDPTSYNGGCAGRLDELGDKQPAGERFCDGDRESTLGEGRDDFSATQGGRP